MLEFIDLVGPCGLEVASCLLYLKGGESDPAFVQVQFAEIHPCLRCLGGDPLPGDEGRGIDVPFTDLPEPAVEFGFSGYEVGKDREYGVIRVVDDVCGHVPDLEELETDLRGEDGLWCRSPVETAYGVPSGTESATRLPGALGLRRTGHLPVSTGHLPEVSEPVILLAGDRLLTRISGPRGDRGHAEPVRGELGTVIIGRGGAD